MPDRDKTESIAPADLAALAAQAADMAAKPADKQIRITAGLLPEDYNQTPLVELLSWEACYIELSRRLHPRVFACGCGSMQRTGHGKTSAGFPVYRCKGCNCTYSLLSGTPFSGTKLGARELVLFMRLWAAATPAVEIGRQVGLHRTSVLQLQDKLRIYASHGGGRA